MIERHAVLPFTLPATGLSQGLMMGDLRNKIAKIERAQADKESLERFLGIWGRPKPREVIVPLPRCRCGLTYYDTEIVDCRGEPSGNRGFFCEACAPDDVHAAVWPDPEIDCMCNDYAREIAAGKAIRYMEEMKRTPPFEWLGGRIPNDADLPQPHIRIKDKGFTLRIADGMLQGAMTQWAWDQGKRPVYNFKSEGRDFSKSDRCLIMATAFYEYTDPEAPKVKLKDQHRFWMRGTDFFWIAGIIKQGCFTMLTTEPGPDVKPYHSRQIVTLRPERGMDWLSAAGSQDNLLVPPPKGTLTHRQTRRDGIEVNE